MLSNFLSFKKNKMLAVDIGSRAIKIVGLSGNAKKPTIECLLETLLPPNAVGDEGINDAEVVGQLLGSLLKDSPIKYTQGSSFIRSNDVIKKIIQVDASLNDLALEESIKIEATKFIPFAPEDIVLDFEVLGLNDKNIGLVDVLLVVCKSEVLEKIEAVFKVAKLDLKVVEVEDFALERLFIKMVQPNLTFNKYALFIDLGAHYTNVYFFNKEKCFYNKKIQFGFSSLLVEIAKKYNIDLLEAEKKLINSGETQVDFELINTQLDMITNEIARQLEVIYSSLHIYEIDHLVLGGGGACLPGVAELLHNKIQTPTSIINLDSYFDIGKNVLNENKLSLSKYSGALGVALRELS